MAICKIRNYDKMFGVMYWPIKSAETPTVGDFVEATSGEILVADAATDNETFAGLANGESLSGNTDKIPILTRVEFECTLTSGSYLYGVGLKIAAAKTLNLDGNADTIAWFLDPGDHTGLTSATQTYGICFTDVLLIGAVAENLVQVVSD